MRPFIVLVLTTLPNLSPLESLVDTDNSDPMHSNQAPFAICLLRSLVPEHALSPTCHPDDTSSSAAAVLHAAVTVSLFGVCAIDMSNTSTC